MHSLDNLSKASATSVYGVIVTRGNGEKGNETVTLKSKINTDVPDAHMVSLQVRICVFSAAAGPLTPPQHTCREA